jgi:hypothetical protein
MVSPDIWLRQQLWQQLWRGPRAVSAYVSLTIQLRCTALSPFVSRDLENPSLYILLINVLICVLLILVDQTDSYRNHRLGFLRLSVAKSRSRIDAPGIKSEQVDRFVNALWFNPEIEFRFRSTRFRSVELTIEALDLLSQTAARYGRRGKKVFVVNQEPIVNAIRLIECLTLEDAEEELVEPLILWLEHPPEFDPEGSHQTVVYATASSPSYICPITRFSRAGSTTLLSYLAQRFFWVYSCRRNYLADPF